MSSIDIFDLSGKCVLVTGASSGLGAHFAQVAAAAGAAVVLAARRVDKLAVQLETIQANGGRAFATAMDVCDGDSITKALDTIEQNFEQIDVLVNNAGVAVTKKFVDTDRDDWQRLLDTNVVGLAEVARAVSLRMINRQQGGAIVNIASMLGVRPGNLTAAYAASKAAVIHLNKAMAIELARYNIRANAILPGFIPTELSELKDNPAALQRMQRVIPMGRVGKETDLDGALLLLASEASRYMTGSCITVDGGHSNNSL